MSSIDDAAFFLLIVVPIPAADGDRARTLGRIRLDAERLDVLLAVHGQHDAVSAGHDRPAEQSAAAHQGFEILRDAAATGAFAATTPTAAAATHPSTAAASLSLRSVCTVRM